MSGNVPTISSLPVAARRFMEAAWSPPDPAGRTRYGEAWRELSAALARAEADSENTSSRTEVAS